MASNNNALSDEILKTEERIRQLSASAVGLSPRAAYSMFNNVDVDKDLGCDVDSWGGDSSVRQKQVTFDNTVSSKGETRGTSSDIIYDVTPEFMAFITFLDEQKVSKQAKSYC